MVVDYKERKMKQSEIMVRYLREFVAAIFAYVIAIVASNSLLPYYPLFHSPWAIPISLAPVIPVIFVLHAIVGLLLNSDELQQRIQLLAIGFAAGVTGFLTFSYGFLEGIGFPKISFVWVLPMLVVFWGFGLAYFSRKYQ
jgi:hypothetical protein